MGFAADRTTLFRVLVLLTIVLAAISFILLITVIANLASQKSMPEICVNKDCLWESSELLNSMNKSVDPCDNFYEYACGNFKNLYPTDGSYYDENTVFSVIQQTNEERLQAILEKPLTKGESQTGFEAKLKRFFQSCQNEHRLTSRGGEGLISAINSLGGWYGLNTARGNNYTSKNINSVLQNVHSKYGISPFFQLAAAADWEKLVPGQTVPERYLIQISPTSLGMNRDYFLPPLTFRKNYKRAGYRKFIRDVVSLLQQDAGTTIPRPAGLTIDVANDVIYVETQLANITKSIPSKRKFEETHRRINWLTANILGVVQWYPLINAAYSEARLTQNTMVHIHDEEFIRAIDALISQLSDRQLNNYIMWKLAAHYVQDLGWEYVHANRVWSKNLYDGYVQFLGKYNWCMKQVKEHLGYALDALFVESHFEQSLDAVYAINDFVKQALTSRIQSMSWMDSDTKKRAVSKLSKTLDMFGHADWLGDRNAVNAYYNSLNFVQDKHFENMVSLWSFRKQQWAKMLQNPIDKNRWPETIFNAHYEYYAPWNELFFTAGLLQHPIYDRNIPQYLNFGSLGRLIGRTLVEAIDYQGAKYNEDGTWVDDTWWTQKTLDNWNGPNGNIPACHESLFANRTLENGRVINVTSAIERLGVEHAREFGGLHSAYKAYKDFVNRYGSEPVLPGLQFDSEDKTFFLSYAQTFCHTRGDDYTYWGMVYFWNQIPEKIMLNEVLKQTPEFTKAYSCSPNTEMYAKPACAGF